MGRCDHRIGHQLRQPGRAGRPQQPAEVGPAPLEMVESVGDGDHPPSDVAVAAHVLRPPQHLPVPGRRPQAQAGRSPAKQEPAGPGARPAAGVQPEPGRRVTRVRPPPGPPGAHRPPVGAPRRPVPTVEVIVLVRVGDRRADRHGQHRRRGQRPTAGHREQRPGASGAGGVRPRRGEQHRHHQAEVAEQDHGRASMSSRWPTPRCIRASWSGPKYHDGSSPRR